jgi:hypothetical protein
MLFLLAVLYRYGACRRSAKWHWVSVGSLFAMVVWLMASAAFSLYVSYFANYDSAPSIRLDKASLLGRGMHTARWSQPAGLAALAACVMLALAFGADPAAAEFQAALYGGFSESFFELIGYAQRRGHYGLAWSILNV